MTSDVGPSTSMPSASASLSRPVQSDALMFAPSPAGPSDLPPMPVPYEDFHFSLDLPTDLDMGDLNFLSGTSERKGGPSNPMTPGLTTSFFASTPQAFHGLEDTHMPSRAGSRRGSLSKSRAPSPRVSALGLGGLSKQPDFGMRPPPPPDFEPPPGSSLFSPAASPFGGFLGAPPSSHKGKQEVNGSLFDASEKSLLSNFLEGFEWDFDPSLPEGMPSFAAAAAERASSAAEVFGLNIQGNGSGHTPIIGGARTGIQGGAESHVAGSASGSASGSGSATASSQSPHDSSSTATSPPNSKRGIKRSGKVGNGSMAKPMSQEADLVNAAFGGLPNWTDEHSESGEAAQIGSKRGPSHFPGPINVTDNLHTGLDLNQLSGLHAEMFRMSAGLDAAASLSQQPPDRTQMDASSGGKKMKIEHEEDPTLQSMSRQDGDGDGNGAGGGVSASSSKRELLTESEKRQNHILSEQRRRNYIREGFKELVVLLDDGRSLGARALGLSSGFGTGVEDEGLDDRTDVEEEDDILAVGRKKPPKKAKKAGPNGARARGKGRGRGGSAGGGAGSKSAVLFQAVDLIRWLDGKNENLVGQCQELEKLAGIPDPENLGISAAEARA